MIDGFHDLRDTIQRLHEADEKLTGAMRWCVYESRGSDGDDHEAWNNEPATNKAPVEVQRMFERSELRRGVVRLVFWSAVIVGLCGLGIWAILHN